MVVTVSGRSMNLIPEFWKADEGIVVMVVLLKSTVARLVQPSNALAPMLLIEEGRVMTTMLVLPLNAALAIFSVPSFTS